MSLPAALQTTSATKMQEGRPNMFGRHSCADAPRGSPMRAFHGRGFRRSRLRAARPLPGFLRDLALRSRVPCRCTLRCVAAPEEEGRPRLRALVSCCFPVLGVTVMDCPCAPAVLSVAGRSVQVMNWRR